MMHVSDKVKQWESATERRMLSGVPVIARLDGRAFHTFTNGLDRPYDLGFQKAMVDTTIALFADSHPVVAYTQSDEITLVWNDCKYFDARIQKMSSVLASVATFAFNRSKMINIPQKMRIPAYFDCRVFQAPPGGPLECLLWRQDDAVKNSISAMAQSLYSHRELHGKHSGELQDLIVARGLNWNDTPEHFKRGVFVKRVKRSKTHEPGTIIEGRDVSGTTYDRYEIEVVSLPPLRRIDNIEGVLFGSEEPRPRKQDEK